MNKWNSIIFDLDGTLWDASQSSANAWAKMAAELKTDLCIDAEAVKNVSGLPFDQCLEAIFGAEVIKKNPELVAGLDRWEKVEILARGGAFYEGVLAGIRELSKSHTLFLVSNCQDWYLEAFYHHSQLKKYFQDWLCFGQTGKAKSENIKSIVERNQLTQVVYVGDTHWDQEAAAIAQVDFLFADYGFGKAKGDALKIKSFAELMVLLTSSQLKI